MNDSHGLSSLARYLSQHFRWIICPRVIGTNSRASEWVDKAEVGAVWAVDLELVQGKREVFCDSGLVLYKLLELQYGPFRAICTRGIGHQNFQCDILGWIRIKNMAEPDVRVATTSQLVDDLELPAVTQPVTEADRMMSALCVVPYLLQALGDSIETEAIVFKVHLVLREGLRTRRIRLLILVRRHILSVGDGASLTFPCAFWEVRMTKVAVDAGRVEKQ